MSKSTRSKALVKPEVGGAFDLYNGKITGTFKELVENKKIVQQWKMDNWPSFSEVTITLTDYDDECEMRLHQTGIPSKEDPHQLKNGWIAQIFRPISLLCGYPIMNQD